MKTRRFRLKLCAALASAAVLGLITGQSAHAQGDAYPHKTVRVVIGYPPGGTTDIVGRLVARELERELKQSFIIDNRAGASGQIGSDLVAKAAPDGYTLLFTIGSHTILPALNKQLPYDVVKDFSAVAMVGTSPNMILVRADHPARTLAALVAQARAKPGQLNYATPGIGTTTHITAAMFERASGVKLNHVPYKGSPQVGQALLAGEVPLALGSIISAGQMVRDGRARALAIVGPKRSPLLPDVPTFDEANAGKVLGDNWLGLLGPAGLPPAVVDRLSKAIASMLAREEFRDQLRAQGVQPSAQGPAEFARTIRDEVDAYRELANAIDLKSQ
ncbi:MAG: Bug family tripartite tricarboxylate transporter substrate binding protein [Burkholderiaceae bacterium]